VLSSSLHAYVELGIELHIVVCTVIYIRRTFTVHYSSLDDDSKNISEDPRLKGDFVLIGCIL
jgi:hypothetical protein